MDEKLRIPKNMLFEPGSDLNEALKILLLDKEETTYALRNDHINVYYKGHSLMNIKKGNESLEISFNGGHLRYCDGHNGVVERKREEGWEKNFVEEWEKINKYLMARIPAGQNGGLTAEKVSKYASNAILYYKGEETNKPSLILKWQIENVHDAKSYNERVIPFLKNEMATFISQKRIIEREYANKLMIIHSWENFDQTDSPGLFFSDCEYHFPGNKRELLSERYPQLLKDLKEWPDFNSSNKEATLLGAPDGVGAIRRKSDTKIVPCLIEIKYGTSAYGGNSGIRKHIRDMVVLADHTIEDRKKEIAFSYLYRKGDLPLEGNAAFPWSENANPLLLFILQTDENDFINAKALLQSELRTLDNKFNNKLIQHIKEKNIDTNFVFTFDIDGRDFLESYKNEDRCFSLEQLI